MSIQLRPIDFAHTSLLFQQQFNVEKYVALAFSQPKGVRLQALVEDAWPEWCATVNMAPWLPYWRKAPAYVANATTPKGKTCPALSCGNVPQAIYVAAVWGFGVEDWCGAREGYSIKLHGSGSGASASGGEATNAAVRSIIQLQGNPKLRAYYEHKYTWDDIFYKNYGVSMPAEFGALDRWLDNLWHQL